MSLSDMPVQGSDGATRYVLLDTITGERYTAPVYKVGVGAEGDAPVPVSSTDPMPVSAAELPLPSGAATQTTLAAVLAKIIAAPATEAKQDAANLLLTAIGQYLDTEIASIITKLAGGLPAALGAGGGLKVDGSGTAIPVSGTFYQATQPVSAASLPLPAGAALEAGNLASILTKLAAGLPAALGTNSGLKVDAAGASLPVSGTFWQTTQPVSIASSGTTTNKLQLTDQFGFVGDCTPNAELITTDKIRLVGTIFNGATLDTNFWTKYESTGTVTQVASELVLTSGTANGHYAVVQSVRRANWVTGTSNKFRTQMRIESADADITARVGVGWGATMPTITDGAYFKFVGSTISVCTLANTSETEVASVNFNGTYVAPTLTNNNTFEILYTLGKVYFLINGVIVHTATFATTHWTSNTTNFYIGADVRNTGNSAAVKYIFRMMNITRLGNMLTMPQYKYITGVTTAQILKYGGGILHSISVGTSVATKTINVWDDTAGSANQMACITLPAGTDPFMLDFQCPFFNGLTVTPNDAGLKLTVVYE